MAGWLNNLPTSPFALSTIGEVADGSVIVAASPFSTEQAESFWEDRCYIDNFPGSPVFKQEFNEFDPVPSDGSDPVQIRRGLTAANRKLNLLNDLFRGGNPRNIYAKNLLLGPDRYGRYSPFQYVDGRVFINGKELTDSQGQVVTRPKIVRVPDGGIPGRESTTPGSADCDVVDTILSETGETLTVYNLDPNAVERPTREYVVVVQMSDGKWFQVTNCCEGEVADVGDPRFSIADIVVDEDVGFAVFTLTFDKPTTGEVEIQFSTTDGTAILPNDYGYTNDHLDVSLDDVDWQDTDTITIPADRTTCYVRTNIVDDGDSETDEYFSITGTRLIGDTANETATAICTIRESDAAGSVSLACCGASTFNTRYDLLIQAGSANPFTVPLRWDPDAAGVTTTYPDGRYYFEATCTDRPDGMDLFIANARSTPDFFVAQKSIIIRFYLYLCGSSVPATFPPTYTATLGWFYAFQEANNASEITGEGTCVTPTNNQYNLGSYNEVTFACSISGLRFNPYLDAAGQRHFFSAEVL